MKLITCIFLALFGAAIHMSPALARGGSGGGGSGGGGSGGGGGGGGGNDPTENGLSIGSAAWFATETARHSMAAYFQVRDLPLEQVDEFAIAIESADTSSVAFVADGIPVNDVCWMQDHFSRSGLTKIVACQSAPYYLWRPLSDGLPALTLINSVESVLRSVTRLDPSALQEVTGARAAYIDSMQVSVTIELPAGERVFVCLLQSGVAGQMPAMSCNE